MPARTRRSRLRSIRSVLALILLVPAVCMLALWAVAARVTVSQAAQAQRFRSAEALYSGAGQALVSALSAERLQAVSWLSGGRQGAVAPLRARFQATDKAAAAFVSAVRASWPAIPSAARPTLTTAESGLARRGVLRLGVTAGRLTPLAAAQAYSTLITAQLSLAARLAAVGDTPLYRQAVATVQAGRAVDLMSGEVALAATAGPGRAMSTTALILLARDVAGQRLLMGDALGQLDRGLGAGYRRVLASGAYRAVAAAEDRIAAAADGRGGPALAAAAAPVLRGYQAAERQDLAGLTSLAAQASNRWLLAAVLAGGVGLIVVLALIGLMAWFGSRISRGLTGLQRAAAGVVADRLPELIADPGEAGDVAVPTGGARIREIAGITHALTAVWRAAVTAAADRAAQRTAASAVVRNAAVRSKALLRRQLGAIGELEVQGDAAEPHVRSGLATVGRLATRMQRHADGLLVLAGDAPDRAWQSPLPAGEVLRAAAAEVDGPRVTMVAESGDAVAAAAAPDVIQLVAELTEYTGRDALPETEITLRASRVGRGLAIEVENRADGIGERELASANAALAGSTAAGFPADDQLGLHVAGRLAARHEIAVTLRRSPVGGVVAIVLLPHAILVADTARDTIVGGSLRRIDRIVSPAELASSPAGSRAATSVPALHVSAVQDPSAAVSAAALAYVVEEPAAAESAAARASVVEPSGTSATALPSAVQEQAAAASAAALPSAVEEPAAAGSRAALASAFDGPAGPLASAVETPPSAASAAALASAFDGPAGPLASAVETPPSAASAAALASAFDGPAGPLTSAVETPPGAASPAAQSSAVEKPATAASPAPWYWLTSSEPAPRPAPEPPAPAAADPPPGDQATPAPLPRRIRNASLTARQRTGGYDAGSQLRGDGGDEPPGGIGV